MAIYHYEVLKSLSTCLFNIHWKEMMTIAFSRVLWVSRVRWYVSTMSAIWMSTKLIKVCQINSFPNEADDISIYKSQWIKLRHHISRRLVFKNVRLIIEDTCKQSCSAFVIHIWISLLIIWKFHHPDNREIYL